MPIIAVEHTTVMDEPQAWKLVAQATNNGNSMPGGYVHTVSALELPAGL